MSARRVRAAAAAVLALALAILSPAALMTGAPGVPGSAWAVEPEEQLEDPALETRARALSKQLRCVVCDNQTIDESDAQVARDMRRFVRSQLEQGASDQHIIDQLVEFYGEYVLLRPRFSLANALIWAAPVIALGLGLYWASKRLRRRAASAGAPFGASPGSAAEPEPEAPQAPPLSAEEEARLAELIRDEAESEPPAR